MFNKTSNTTGAKKGSSNKTWITKEEIKKLFPQGYRKCDFFSSPVEFWAMSKETCLKWKSTALINLNDKLDLPKNLQEASYIGHSSDTELFTHLLNLNNKKLKTVSPPNNTSTNHEDNRTNNDLVKNICNINKTCYTCNNVCKCSGLQFNRLKNSFSKNNCDTVALLSKENLVVPEIQSINEFDKFSIKSLPNYILNNNDVNVTYMPEPNTSANCDILEIGSVSESEKIFNDNITLLQNTPNSIQSSPLDYRVTGMTGQVMQELTFNENNECYENVLKYFHLNSISDIFQGL